MNASRPGSQATPAKRTALRVEDVDDAAVAVDGRGAAAGSPSSATGTRARGERHADILPPRRRCRGTSHPVALLGEVVGDGVRVADQHVLQLCVRVGRRRGSRVITTIATVRGVPDVACCTRPPRRLRARGPRALGPVTVTAVRLEASPPRRSGSGRPPRRSAVRARSASKLTPAGPPASRDGDRRASATRVGMRALDDARDRDGHVGRVGEKRRGAAIAQKQARTR